jgi:hypothetical protein
MAGGWLCFESVAEKRRLHPIPPGWENGSDAELWQLCSGATPVRRRTIGPLAPELLA